MKKYLPVILCVIIVLVLAPLCIGYGKRNYPNEFYNVYLEEQLLGTVKSKEELVTLIYQYFEEINKEPVVYHWKYKMDEINVAEVSTV